MNFKNFSDAQLVTDTKRAVGEERQAILAVLAVLERLREIQTRSVHLTMGFPSLHEFCVKELHYSDGAAHRRIQAMRLVIDLPKAKDAIADGSLSLSTATSLQKYFKSDENTCSTIKEKEEVLDQVKGKSKAECDRILKPKQTGTMIRFLADDETMQLLKRLSELTAIGEKNAAGLIKRVAVIALRAIDPMNRKPVSSKPGKTPPPKSASPEKLGSKTAPEKLNPNLTTENPCPKPTTASRYVAAAVEHGVWTRDGGQCTFVNPLTRRRCSSRFGLQLDHIIPLACDGPSTLENLRLLCQGHNLLAAERVFGKEKMAHFKRH